MFNREGGESFFMMHTHDGQNHYFGIVRRREMDSNREVTEEIQRVVNIGHNISRSVLSILQRFTSLTVVAIDNEDPDPQREFQRVYKETHPPLFYLQRLMFSLCKRDLRLGLEFLEYQESHPLSAQNEKKLTFHQWNEWEYLTPWLERSKPEGRQVMSTLNQELWGRAAISDFSKFAEERMKEIQFHLFFVCTIAALDAFPKLFIVKEGTVRLYRWAIVHSADDFCLSLPEPGRFVISPQINRQNGHLKLGVQKRKHLRISLRSDRSHSWIPCFQLWNDVNVLLSEQFPQDLTCICISYLHHLGDHRLGFHSFLYQQRKQIVEGR
jgi:hypothetical protein